MSDSAHWGELRWGNRRQKKRLEQIEAFLSSPDPTDRRFIRNQKLGWDLVRAVSAKVDLNASVGLIDVKTVISYLREQLSRTQIKTVWRRTACMLNMSRGAKAHAFRILGREEEAQQVLASVWLDAESCESCQAEVLRRRSFVLAQLGRKELALSSCSQAIERYDALPDYGHNNYRNGLASSLWAKCVVLDYFGDTTLAIRAAFQALSATDPVVSAQLFGRINHSLAICIRRSGAPGDLALARSFLQNSTKILRINRTQVTEPLAKTVWLLGAIEADARNMETARDLLREALEMLCSLKMSHDAVVLLTDLALTFNTLDGVLSAIKLIYEWSTTKKDLRIPPWVGEQGEKLQEVAALTRDRKNSILRIRYNLLEIRAEAGGDRIMPRFRD